jgi:hypothetical protein
MNASKQLLNGENILRNEAYNKGARCVDLDMGMNIDMDMDMDMDMNMEIYRYIDP